MESLFRVKSDQHKHFKITISNVFFDLFLQNLPQIFVTEELACYCYQIKQVDDVLFEELLEQLLDWYLTSTLDHDDEEQLKIWILDKVMNSIIEANNELDLLFHLLVLRVYTCSMQSLELFQKVHKMRHVGTVLIESFC